MRINLHLFFDEDTALIAVDADQILIWIKYLALGSWCICSFDIFGFDFKNCTGYACLSSSNTATSAAKSVRLRKISLYACLLIIGSKFYLKEISFFKIPLLKKHYHSLIIH